MTEDLIRYLHDVSRRDFGAFAICAVRYSMGRWTYMPSEIARIVRAIAPSLSPVDRRRDIREQEPRGLGTPEDRVTWLRLAEELEAMDADE